MKILALRGRNLASFEGDFNLDFQSEPLKSAPLYCIVGATGSGKSTLLDALCLALFGKTPRLAGEKALAQNLIDDMGQPLSLSDPRLILRRGQGEGYAEVDFVSQGKRLRAQWKVRRSRNSPKGALQKVSRILMDLDQGNTLEGSLNEERMQAYLGMNFKQFCRSVLLAQGEFAAFLKAKGDERAELLETLTGTEVYAQISAQVYSRYKSYVDRLAEFQVQGQMLEYLSDDAFAELLGGQERYSAQISQYKLQSAQIEKALHWFKLANEYQANLTLLEQRQQDLQVQKLEFQFMEKQMHEYELALPLQSQFQNWQNQIQLLEKQRLDAQDLKVKLSEAMEQSLRASHNLANGKEKFAQTEVQIKAKQSQVLAALQVEQQVSYMAEQYSQASHELESLNSALAAEEREYLALQLELQKLGLESDRCKAQMEQAVQDGVQELQKDWAYFAQILDQAQNCQDQLKNLELKRQDSVHKSEILSGQLMQNQVKQIDLKSNIDNLLHEFALSSVKIQSIPEISKKLQELRVEFHNWQNWFESAKQAQELQLKVNELVQIQAKNSDEGLGISNEIQLLHEKIIVLQNEERISNQWKALENSLEQSLQQLRTQLKHGVHCPLCGSKEHPLLSDPLLSEQIAAAKARREELENQVAETQRSIKSHEEYFQKHQLKQVELDKEIEHLQRQLEKINLELRGSPAENCTLEQVGQKCSDLNIQILELSESLAKSQLDLEKQSALSAQLDKLKLELSSLEMDDVRLNSLLEQCKRNLVETAVSSKELSSQLDDLGAKWKQQLNSNVSQWELFVERIPQAKAKLGQRVEEFSRDLALSQELAFKVEQLSQKTKAMEQVKVHRLQIQDDASQKVKALEVQLSVLKAERNSHCPELDLKAYALRLENELKYAQKELNDLSSQDDLFKHKILVQKERLEGVESELYKTDNFVQLLESKWNTDFRSTFESHASGLESADLYQKIIDWGTEIYPSLKAKSDELKELSIKLQSEISLVKNQWELHKENSPQGVYDANFEESQKCALIESQDLTAQFEAKWTEIEAKIISHKRNQQRHAHLLEQINELESESRIWKLLNEYIGSQDGKKFRIYAQQYTLNLLVHQANLQLAKINPRYQIQKEQDSLALVIVDLNMGGARRPLQSLSGGESFLASLALALGLSALSGTSSALETLFIDEGFGTLDRDTLRIAMEALDSLQAQGRKVGIITHVEELKERIETQIVVEKTGTKSHLRIK